MINIPPVIGLVIALVVGAGAGGASTHLYHKKELAEADAHQLKKDDKKAAKISHETEIAKRDNKVIKTIVQYRDKIVKIPTELTQDEIHTICINQLLPDNVMQSIRTEATKARNRIDDVYNDDAASGS